MKDEEFFSNPLDVVDDLANSLGRIVGAGHDHAGYSHGAGKLCTLASRIMPYPTSGLRFGSVRFFGGAWPLTSTEMLETAASAPASLSPARNLVVSRAGKVYDARGEFGGLPPANCLSRLSSNRTRIVVPVLELFRTSVPRSDIALARIFVPAPNHVSVCVDGKYTSADSWH